MFPVFTLIFVQFIEGARHQMGHPIKNLYNTSPCRYMYPNLIPCYRIIPLYHPMSSHPPIPNIFLFLDMIEQFNTMKIIEKTHSLFSQMEPRMMRSKKSKFLPACSQKFHHFPVLFSMVFPFSPSVSMAFPSLDHDGPQMLNNVHSERMKLRLQQVMAVTGPMHVRFLIYVTRTYYAYIYIYTL